MLSVCAPNLCTKIKKSLEPVNLRARPRLHMATKQTEVALRNRLLNAFDSVGRARIAPYIEIVTAKRGDVLCESGGTPTYAYFPDGAVLSLLTVLKDGAAIETANMGREGAFGLCAAMYSWPSFYNRTPWHSYGSFTQCLVQSPGALLRIPISALRREFEHSAYSRSLLVSYTDALMAQIQQTVACTAHHRIQERICRWLLAMHDRAEGEDLSYTHEFLADILGINRKSATLALQALQKLGLVSYSRGKIQVVDRKGLERASCECYAIIKEHHEAVLNPPLQVIQEKAPVLSGTGHGAR
jgi:CRP-like cAMP-binding protein